MNQKRCKHCGGILEIRKTKDTPERAKKQYYYSAYYYCPRCKKLYHDEKFKVENTQGESLFSSLHPSPFTLSPSYDVEIWTDGACVYNGTPKARAAWAFVTHSAGSGRSGKTERAGRVEGKQTNNVAEGLAIYHALSWASEKGYKKIRLHTDSQISLFNLKKHPSKVRENAEIFHKIAQVITGAHLEVDYVKVLGHSGDPNNERADALANGLVAKK